MNIYFDTGVLLPLYIEEVFSDSVTTFMEAHHEPVPINLFHEAEFENALRLKVFRGDIPSSKVTQILRDRDEDITLGRLVRRPVNWVQALEEAWRLGALVTAHTGCRTLDLLHVAIAVKWGCGQFVTADERQMKAARKAGLKVVEIGAGGAG